MSLDRVAAPKPRPASASPSPAIAKPVVRLASVKSGAFDDVKGAVATAIPRQLAGVTRQSPGVTRQSPGVTLRPQAPLHHAVQHALQHAASRRLQPQGLGLDSAAARLRMVARLRRLGIRDERVLDVLASVPRHRFVDAALAAQAYEDTSLPIGLNQTISKPSVVARMIELLMAGPNAHAANHLGRVLEIGTGCGYQAAVLSHLGKSVLSIERLRPLHEKARELLAPFRAASTGTGGANIRLVHGDGMLGHGPDAPYDSIISAAGGDRLPQAWLDQLALGGRLVAPLHDIRHGGQVLVVIDRTDAGFERSIHESVHFVPLKSGVD